MSISSHLTPDPERRLWLILERTRHALERSELKLAGLTALAAFQTVFIDDLASGPLAFAARATLMAAIALGVLGFSPLIGLSKRLPGLDPARDKARSGDGMICIDDIAQFTHAELVLRLDRYLGGGVTATQYYEDLVSQIVSGARVAIRKRRLFHLAGLMVAAAELLLLAQVIHG